jgi:hypothetical protein
MIIVFKVVMCEEGNIFGGGYVFVLYNMWNRNKERRRERLCRWNS